jgi:hypothetical protein
MTDAALLEDICVAPVAQPLWAMSLGDKELFHSNIIAWFIERHPQAAVHAFGDWTNRDASNTKLAVYRERRHLVMVFALRSGTGEQARLERADVEPCPVCLGRDARR